MPRPNWSERYAGTNRTCKTSARSAPATLNGTIRTFMRRSTRLALGFSKKLQNLEAAVQLHLAYYNFCWQMRENGKSGRLRPAPAVQAGVTDHDWTIEELFDNVM